MGTDRPIQPHKLTPREYEVYAAGYTAAWLHVSQQAQLRGADFDQDMILVFLEGGAQLRADHAARMRAAEVQQPPRLLSCGFCYEENGEEVHPHPQCPVTAPRPVNWEVIRGYARQLQEGLWDVEDAPSGPAAPSAHSSDGLLAGFSEGADEL
jgi:hypothetical protein